MTKNLREGFIITTALRPFATLRMTRTYATFKARLLTKERGNFKKGYAASTLFFIEDIKLL